VPEKMPLSEVAMLPGLYTSSCMGTQAFWKLLKEGVLGQTELKQQGMHVLFAVVQPPNVLVLSNTDPRDMKALTGLKIRSSGGPQDLIIKSLGAVPIRMTGPEMYESLSRQTISGMIVSYQSMFAYSWVDVSKYATQDLSYGGFSFTYMISESRWKQLPEKLRRVMTEVGEETNRRLCERMDKDIDLTIEKLRQRGMTIGPLTPVAKGATQAALSGVLTQWSSNLDRQGKPATRTLSEFIAATKQ
jgi:TRAP-type C4-dicarboxylate transport system substrate-binding protein